MRRPLVKFSVSFVAFAPGKLLMKNIDVVTDKKSLYMITFK